MANDERTALQRATDALLQRLHGYGLTDLLAREVAGGASAERIARRLYFLTDEAVDLSGRTIRRWCHELDIEQHAEALAS